MKRLKALRRITDAGYNLRRGAFEVVPVVLFDEWAAKGWAEEAKPEPVKAAKK